MKAKDPFIETHTTYHPHQNKNFGQEVDRLYGELESIQKIMLLIENKYLTIIAEIHKNGPQHNAQMQLLEISHFLQKNKWKEIEVYIDEVQTIFQSVDSSIDESELKDKE